MDRTVWVATMTAACPIPSPTFQLLQGRAEELPLPLQPHPQNQPHGFHEATTLNPIPDISLAKKSGYFNLLTTHKVYPFPSGIF